MALRRLGDKSLSEPMMVSLPTHIWVTRPVYSGSHNSGTYATMLEIHVNIDIIGN